MMSKKKLLSLPENLWLGPLPSQSLSFVSFCPLLSNTTSPSDRTGLLGEVWVGAHTIQAGERRREVQHHGQRHRRAQQEVTLPGL